MKPVVTMPQTFLVGNLWDLQANRLGFLEEVYHTCGEVGIFYLGYKKIYTFTAPKYAHSILVQNSKYFEKGPILRKFSKPFMGDGLLSCLNKDHLKKRRFLASAFHRRTLTSFVPIIQRLSEESLNWTSGSQVELYPEMMKLTMKIIGHILLSIDIEEYSPMLAQALHVGMNDVSERIRTPLYPPLWVPTAANRKTKKHLRFIDDFLIEMIHQRRISLQENGNISDESSPTDVLTLLIQASDEEGRGLSDREIRDELATLIFAGFETTTNALAWTLCLLNEHQEVLQKGREEVQSVLQSQDCSVEHLSQLKYIQSILEESMRIYPPAHTVGRITVSDIDIEGISLKKGDIVLVCPYLMHRISEVFPQPEIFRPERFFYEEERSRIPKYTYMPFGLGPRSCIGGQLAMMESKIILATLLQKKFDWGLMEGFPKPYTTVSIRPEGNIPVQIT